MLLTQLQAQLAHLANLALGTLPARRSRGQGLVEYALIIALVAIVVIAALLLLGPAIKGVFLNIVDNL